MEQNITITVAKEGFLGKLFIPKKNLFQGKALIQFGGSEGNFKSTCELASLFCSKGITALALAYWNGPGLKDTLAKVPVENIQKAALWLQGKGWNKIGLWGISLGAEYALLAGSLLPSLISCVIAISPMDVVSQGCSSKGIAHMVNAPAFSWQEKPLPYMSIPQWSLGRVLQKSLLAREVTMAFAYKDARPKAPDDSIIKVEHISGPILLLSAKEDSIWPSAQASERIIKRLDAHNFAYPHIHLCYEFGSHLLYPSLQGKAGKLFRMERKHPQECSQAKEDSFIRTLQFLQAW